MPEVETSQTVTTADELITAEVIKSQIPAEETGVVAAVAEASYGCLKTASLTTVAAASDDLIPADPTVAALTAAIEAGKPIRQQVVGNTPVKLGGPTDNIWQDVRLGELNLGRALSDSYRFLLPARILPQKMPAESGRKFPLEFRSARVRSSTCCPLEIIW